ncbi:MAG: quaternary ammonium compound efflux SMR transporter SugE [Alcaligenaceae bacterium]|nr:quaternary ammonium compound efflux SMR transporter SugE [Alcaligenaceae bacterium]HZJ97518.1 quaternary ammonium compound efflux SMR transporter SugE [Oligella sp.]
MPWLYLLIAGVFEIVWAFSMKQSHGFSRFIPSVITISAMIISFWLLAIAMRTIPLGTAYTIWTGIGAVGAFLIGITLLGEPVNFLRILAALLIVSGLILMKMSSS